MQKLKMRKNLRTRNNIVKNKDKIILFDKEMEKIY